MTKPGPGSLSEAFQQRLPVVVTRNIHTIPQERFNTDVRRATAALGLVVPAGARSPPRWRGSAREPRSGVGDARSASRPCPDNRAVYEVIEIIAREAASAHHQRLTACGCYDYATFMATAKLLYRRLDALFGSLKTRRSQSKLIEGFVEDALANLKDDLRLRAGLVYAERRDNFALVKTVGDARRAGRRDARPALSAARRARAPPRLHLPRRPTRRARRSGSASCPRAAAAGLIVGQRPQRYAILFLLADGWQLEELDFALNTIRASLDARLVDARVRGSFREAAEIQQSLLVEEPPAFAGFDLAARSVPAEEVGGDFYDFHDFGEGMLGLAIGDASGHGLPGGAPGARRGDGPAHGDREGAEGRARLREAQPRDPPLAAVEPLRERLLRRARARRQPRLRERRPPAADPLLPRVQSRQGRARSS